LLRVVTLFISLAGIALAWQFWEDIKTHKIDVRRNWFMQGCGLFAAILVHAWFYYFIAVLVVIIFNEFIKSQEKRLGYAIFGDGDKSLMVWIVPGLTILSVFYSALFLMAMVVAMSGFLAYKFFVNHKSKVPGLIFIVVGYIVTVAFWYGGGI